MLKNNKERREYIDDERNWIHITYAPLIELVPGYNYPFINVLKLKGTTIYKIRALMYDQYQGAHYATLGCYLYNQNGLLDNIYSFSDAQLVNYLKEKKI